MNTPMSWQPCKFDMRDAAAAYRRALERGAWAVPVHVEVMELNIPAIHGVGASRLYFVDRWREFSIYDVDFTTIPGVVEDVVDAPVTKLVVVVVSFVPVLLAIIGSVRFTSASSVRP